MPHSSHQFRYLCAKKMLKKLLVISILLGLFAPFALTFLSIQLFAQYQGEVAHEDLALEEQGKTEIYAKDADGNTNAPAWYTINMRAMYRINENFSLSCGIENLGDQRYRPYSSGVSGAGRNFYSSLRINF